MQFLVAEVTNSYDTETAGGTPYKNIQVLCYGSQVHLIDGATVKNVVKKNGVSIISTLLNGGKVKRLVKVHDEHGILKVVSGGLLRAFVLPFLSEDGRTIVYRALKNQKAESYPDLNEEPFSVSVSDFQNRTWKEEIQNIPIGRVSHFMMKSGSVGYNYIAA